MEIKRIHCKIAYYKMMLNEYKSRDKKRFADSLSGKISPQQSVMQVREDVPFILMVEEALSNNLSKKIRLFLEKSYIILRFYLSRKRVRLTRCTK